MQIEKAQFYTCTTLKNCSEGISNFFNDEPYSYLMNSFSYILYVVLHHISWTSYKFTVDSTAP